MEARSAAKVRYGAMQALLVLAAAALPAGAGATDLFKCGSTYQDRACNDKPVQQRFSRTQGEFSIEQVNPTTDRDCARTARGAMAWWNRMAAGESVDKLNAEIQALNISRYEKSQLRDGLTAMRGYRGDPVQVRGEFENQCMAYKRRHGVPTEREVAQGGAEMSSSYATRRASYAAEAEASARRHEMQLQMDARRREMDARLAEMAARRAEIDARRAAMR